MYAREGTEPDGSCLGPGATVSLMTFVLKRICKNGDVAPEPLPILCAEKQRLLKDYADAVSECNRLQSAQVAAGKRGEGFTFEEEIAKAYQWRQNVKDSILGHVEK